MGSFPPCDSLWAGKASYLYRDKELRAFLSLLLDICSRHVAWTLSSATPTQTRNWEPVTHRSKTSGDSIPSVRATQFLGQQGRQGSTHARASCGRSTSFSKDSIWPLVLIYQPLCHFYSFTILVL